MEMPGSKVTAGRTTAAAEGDVVVLLIGMRINHFWAVHHWLPVLVAMPRMLRELARDKSRGLLGHVLLTASPRTYYVVQYWDSKEHLYAYAAAPDMLHHKAWTLMNRKERAGKARQHVGIWHEAYVVPEGSYESIYADMPPFGLGAAHGVVPVEKRGQRAADRFAHRSAEGAAAGTPTEG
jgi:heme-degrading monooxygenase HmoA